ncbi:MAG: ABC transporter substrate-binding protein [Variibacter sp.]
MSKDYRFGSLTRTSLKALMRTLVIATVALAPSFASGQPPAKITVATGIDPTFAPWVVAVKKDFFKKQGIESELKSFDDGNVALDSLLTGNADIGGTSELGGIVRMARGGKLYLMGSGAQYADFFGLVAKNSIKQPKDIEGKAIGLPKGSGAHLYFAKYAAFHKIDTSKVNLRFLQAPESVAALARGDIEGFFLWDPWLTRAATTVPDTHIAARSGQDNVFRLNVFIYFSDRLASNEELSKKVLKGLIEAAEWTMANRSEAAKIVAEAYRMPVPVTEEIMKPIAWNVHYDKVFKDYLKDAGEFAVSAGIAPSVPNIDAFVRPGPLKAVAPERVKE